jgi:hypothetical protein
MLLRTIYAQGCVIAGNVEKCGKGVVRSHAVIGDQSSGLKSRRGITHSPRQYCGAVFK